MKKSITWVLCGVVLAALGAAWFGYDRFYRIPEGPALPPRPPTRDYPVEAVALNDRAMAILIEDPTEALRLLDQALRLDEDYHTALANKASLLIIRQEYGSAARCYEKLAELRPRVAEYYLGHAFCLARQGDARGAEDRLLHTLSAYSCRMDAEPFWARLNRAAVLSLLGRRHVARKELRELEAEWPDSDLQSMASALQTAIEEAPAEDPWSVLGLPE